MKIWHVVDQELTLTFFTLAAAHYYADSATIPTVLCESEVTDREYAVLKEMEAKVAAAEAANASELPVQFNAGPQNTPLTREQVEHCRRIGRDETNRSTVIGLSELDALCDTAILGIEAIARLKAKNP